MSIKRTFDNLYYLKIIPDQTVSATGHCLLVKLKKNGLFSAGPM